MKKENKKKFLVLGNPLIEKDNIVLKVLPELKKKFPLMEFIEIDPTENLEKYGKNLRIIDVVEGIKKVQLIKLNSLKDFDKLQVNKISMHDFDLGWNLRLLKKIGLIDKVEIIGVPCEMNRETAFKEISEMLKMFNKVK